MEHSKILDASIVTENLSRSLASWIFFDGQIDRPTFGVIEATYWSLKKGLGH